MWIPLVASIASTLAALAARAELVHEGVEGPAIESLEVTPGGPVRFADLQATRTPGKVVVSFPARGEAVYVPHCAGRGRVLVDGVVKDPGSRGPLVVRLGDAATHEVKIEVTASAYEKRVACSEPPRAGAVVATHEGFSVMRFPSPHEKKHAEAGQAVVFVPKGHDTTKPAGLLVGVHPWNGGPWTYAAYRELVEEAEARGLVLLMPSGLGNSLYTADAEDEVMRAIDRLTAAIPIDPQRVSIWGASMGGAGATTISLHRPDRFAFVASWFGDSKYDLTTYVKGILGGEAGARQVNALDVIENARHLPIMLVHGEDDRTSPMVQSTMLYEAMKKAGFTADLAREPGMGHEGPLVAKHLRAMVARAAAARAPLYPARVSYRSVRPIDTGAYGVRLVRSGAGDAVVDLERRADGVHVLRAEGVREIVLEPGALGAGDGDPVHGASAALVRWRR